MFGGLSLLITWIYENTVTSELIVPTPTKIVYDLVDLIDAGYKIEYTTRVNNSFDYEQLFMLPYSLRNVSHKFKMANFIPLFSNVAFLKRYGNLGDKIALYWQSTPSDLVDILAQLQLRSKTGLELYKNSNFILI
jgi:hypothetical protein